MSQLLAWIWWFAVRWSGISPALAALDGSQGLLGVASAGVPPAMPRLPGRDSPGPGSCGDPVPYLGGEAFRRFASAAVPGAAPPSTSGTSCGQASERSSASSPVTA